MEYTNIIGVDLAKRKFHLVTIDSAGKKIFAKKLFRDEVLPYFIEQNKDKVLVVMEACGGCHYWARELQNMGFAVKLLKPKDIKPYAKSRQKNDTNDALAIAKAGRDPELKAVVAKSEKEQEVMLLHKVRQNTICERVAKTNSLISSLHEFGYVTKLGKARFAKEAKDEIAKAFEEKFISKEARRILLLEEKEIAKLLEKESAIDKQITMQNKSSVKATRLQTIHGIGPINASILEICNAENYTSSRDFASSLGLVPRQNTTGGNIVLGSITKQGNRYVRTMLIQGARSVVIRAKKTKESTDPLILFANKLLKTKTFNKTAVAVANKLARIVWAVSVKQKVYGEY